MITPKIGQKRELLNLANKNASIALLEKFALIDRDEERTIKAVETLGQKLRYLYTAQNRSVR